MSACKGDDSGNCCGVCHLKVVAVMASHQRPEITKRACKELQSMGCEVVLVVSTHSDMEALIEFNPVQFPNEPLGAKWQHAVDVAKTKNPDLLVTCGSDDILCKDYLKNAYKLILKGFEMVGVSAWHMEETRTKRTWRAHYKHVPDFPVGSGRVFTKSLLNRIGWQLFDTKADRRLDDKAMSHKIKKYISTEIEKDGLIVTAIKGDWIQLNPLNKFFKAPTIGIKQI